MRNQIFSAIIIVGLLLIPSTVITRAQSVTADLSMSKPSGTKTNQPKAKKKSMRKGVVQDVARKSKDSAEDVAKGGETGAAATGREAAKVAKGTKVGAKGVSKDAAKVAKKTGRAASTAGKKVKRIL